MYADVDTEGEIDISAIGIHGHAPYRSAVARCRELCHVRCGQRRILVECEWVLGVAVTPCGCRCEDFVLALSLCF